MNLDVSIKTEWVQLQGTLWQLSLAKYWRKWEIYRVRHTWLVEMENKWDLQGRGGKRKAKESVCWIIQRPLSVWVSINEVQGVHQRLHYSGASKACLPVCTECINIHKYIHVWNAHYLHEHAHSKVCMHTYLCTYDYRQFPQTHIGIYIKVQAST